MTRYLVHPPATAEPAGARLGAEHAPPIPETLSAVPEKRVFFAVDSYFRDSWEDLRALPAEEIDHVLRRHATLLLKPESMVARRADVALEWLREQGVVVAAERVRINPHQTRALWHFQWNVATRERRDLCDLIAAAGDSLFVVARLPEDPVPATVRLSNLKGPADPARRQPWQLRHRLGGDNFLLNFVHAADEPADLVRELGILFDGPARRRIYRALLSGVDRYPDAQRYVTRLYRQSSAHDLRLRGVLRRMTDLLGNAAASPAAAELLAALNAAENGLPVRWTELRALAARAGLTVPPWDDIVLGSHLAITSDPGTPILTTVSPDQWQRRDPAADRVPAVPRPAARPGERPAPPTLHYGQAIARRTVHKAGIEEVMVTDSASLSTEEFLVAAELPTAHSYYSDTTTPALRFELMPLLEACRQAGYAVIHRHLGLPTDRRFIIRGYQMHLCPEILFAARPRPIRVSINCRVERSWERAGRVAGMHLGYSMSTPDGEPIGTARVALYWVGPAQWAQMRAESRARQGMPDEIGAAPVWGTPVPARSVGRDCDRNVVLADVDCRDGRFAAGVVVNPGNHGMFEHEQDHVPGMVLMEAARQSAMVAVAEAVGLPPEALSVAGIDAQFTAMAELDLPLRITASARTATSGGAPVGTVTAEIRQGDVRIFRASVDVAGATVAEPAYAAAADGGRTG
ncbi:AfsA-related hotdog domain-containing protein [Gandjariella thermophila]|uniref:Nucleoside diphosphate kinase n=1 Tax=Gandjariella thermophila TaxID=1931992 RepID=A0A4D4J514_9PSEU|nr:AfsA-related hotdog domain-containing protein [Gandjariella thermophila]GDY29626.1 hypothetical protein GTS_12590 [Gandjariella thermophila]